MKITELKEQKWRVVKRKDAQGNVVKDRESYHIPREPITASIGQRIINYVLDYVLRMLFIFFLFYVIGMFLTETGLEVLSATSGSEQWISNLVVLICIPLYYIFFEYATGRTPGKYLTRTVVIDEYAKRPGMEQIFIRSVSRLVPFDGLSYFNDESRGWHDKWSKTFVVSTEEWETLKKLQEEQAFSYLERLEQDTGV